MQTIYLHDNYNCDKRLSHVTFCLFGMESIPGHRDQYERMAQSILNGHLYLEYEDVDPRLSEMENPYDPQARKELGIYYHWDHAFYNGKYYMYFGIVPVFLLFLPYQLLTGNALTTYKATQIFTVGTILAIFALFDFLRKNFFLKCHLTYI